MRRFKAEFGSQKEPSQETEESLAHQIEMIREELFDVPFDESGKEIVQKFKNNFSRLKDFMHAVDKEIGSMQVFNEKGSNNYDADETKDKYSEITSVQQLRHLLRNYEGLVEG